MLEVCPSSSWCIISGGGWRCHCSVIHAFVQDLDAAAGGEQQLLLDREGVDISPHAGIVQS